MVKDNLLMDNILINIKLNEKKDDTNNVASMVMQIFADYNIINNNIYLNVFEKNKKEKMLNWLKHPRLPGSIPYSSPDFQIDNQDTKVKTFGWGASKSLTN